MHTGKVFISHASADKTFVDKLVADLAGQGIPVWYDKLDLKLGESIPAAIGTGLAEAKYFAIVLSKASVASKWVQEELNSALMKQVAAGGTFVLPLLLEDCDIPMLLAHRRRADFRTNYDQALSELLALWGKDSSACATTGKEAVHPWPDIEMPDTEYVYLHSTRFDKFFRMNCSLDWTATKTIDYLTATLNLPCRIDVPSVGMHWSFTYGLRIEGKGVPLDTTLRAAGLSVGSVIQIGISGRYEDLYEKELKEAFSPGKVYLETMERHRRLEWLQQQVASRRLLTQADLKKIADSCFKHV
jgi:hypothetical protein